MAGPRRRKGRLAAAVAAIVAGPAVLGCALASVATAPALELAPLVPGARRRKGGKAFFAEEGTPPGCRLRQLPTALATEALEELEGGVMDETQGGPQSKLELQWGYFALRTGAPLRRKRPLAALPACAELVRRANEAFGLEGRPEERIQVVVRRYQPGMQCLGHIDSTKFFDEPNLFITLRSAGPPDGLRLYANGTEYLVREAPGLAVCLEGPGRYETFHSVPRVTAPRVSLTWRWFHEEVLEHLKVSAGLN